MKKNIYKISVLSLYRNMFSYKGYLSDQLIITKKYNLIMNFLLKILRIDHFQLSCKEFEITYLKI